jgi:hypothetical protein
MLPRRSRRVLPSLLLAALLLGTFGCESYFFLPFMGQSAGALDGGSVLGQAFTEDLILERTFTSGTSVTTVTYTIGDEHRVPLAVDFNGDGKLDPVVGYGRSQAVIQILLSRPGTSAVDPISLTLDSKRDMENLADVAVGDIDNDGYLDIVAAAEAAVWYFHHPSSGDPTDLRDWGNRDPNDGLRERVDASYDQVTDNELMAIITQAIGPGVNLDDYIVTVEQLYTNVEIGDFDNDGDHDIAASRSFVITLTPRPEAPVEPLQIVDGDVMIFVNPGFAPDGNLWTQVSIGKHERQWRLDRDGASGLLACDMDGDGYLDVVSSAREDNNAQIAWFRNPGPPLTTENPWTQYRVGSLRDSWAIDVADLTGDGWPDVVATGAEQMQMLLFEHPGVTFPDDRFDYDWETHPIVTFGSFQPRDVRALDLDNDGRLELVVGGTNGAVRYFEAPSDPRNEWNGVVIVTFDSQGEVGLLGYGDLDGDGDLDLVAVVNATEANESRTVWIRNDLIN